MPGAFREFAPAALAAAAVGLVAATVGPAGVLVLLVIMVLGVAGLLVRFRSAGTSEPRFPIATFLAAIAVLSVAWIGIQAGPTPVSDLPFLAMLPLLVLPALRYQGLFPVPSWLLWVAFGLLASALLPALFVIHPPPIILNAASAATFNAFSPRTSAATALARMEYVLILMPVVIGALSGSWARARVFADLWVAGAAISAAVACADQLGGAGIAHALGVGLQESGGGTGARAIGLTVHPNYLGLFSAMALPLAITRITQTSGLLRIAAAGATAVLVLSIQLSGSRIGVFAACVGVAVLLILIPRFRTRIVIALAVFGLAAIVFLFVAAPSDQSAIGRLIGDQAANSATDTRLTVISKSLAIGLDHPLTGVGFDRVFDSHSAPAQFLQAGGIVALASFALWAFGFGRLGVQLSRNPRVPAFSSELAAALLAGLMAWLVAGIVNPQIAERFMYVPAGVLLGLGLAAARLSRSPERPRTEIQRDFNNAQPVAAAGMPPEPEESSPAHPAPVSR